MQTLVTPSIGQPVLVPNSWQVIDPTDVQGPVEVIAPYQKEDPIFYAARYRAKSKRRAESSVETSSVECSHKRSVGIIKPRTTPHSSPTQLHGPIRNVQLYGNRQEIWTTWTEGTETDGNSDMNAPKGAATAQHPPLNFKKTKIVF